MNKLIITADDFGMSPAVNDAIIQCIAAGIVTSTNVMTNMAYYRDATSLKNSGASLGIHWTLSCGKPVLPRNEIPSLVSNDGIFFSYSEFRNRFRKNMIEKEDIRKELTAQYRLYVDVLGLPEYWNTHQNVHVDFRIYQLFVKIAQELSIHKMRSHQRIYVPGRTTSGKRSLIWRIAEPAKARLLTAWQNHAREIGITAPDGRIVYLSKKDVNDIEYMASHIQWKDNKIAELVIHPATCCDSEYFGNIADQRLDEFRIFSSPETRQKIEKNGIELTNFCHL